MHPSPLPLNPRRRESPPSLSLRLGFRSLLRLLPAHLQDIASHAFAYCSSLTDIQIPPTVTHIGSNVFSHCRSLKEIAVPDSVAELESYAFSECSSLEKATLPANDKLLGEYLFTGCHRLREIICLSPVPRPSTVAARSSTPPKATCTKNAP